YLSGDGTFEAAVAAAKHYLEKPASKLTLREQLLKDIYEVFETTKQRFVYSEELCAQLNRMIDSPWPEYKHHGLNPSNLAWLIKDYEILPVKDDTSRKRGYYLNAFADTWRRLLGLEMPEHAGAY